jgi:hypothetical protein
VPTVLSAIASGGSTIRSSRSSRGRWHSGADRPLHRFPRRALARALVADRRQRLARHPFVAICLLAGLQTISPSLYEAAALDGANAWQRFRHVTVPMLMPILAVVLTFSCSSPSPISSWSTRSRAAAAEHDPPDGDARLPARHSRRRSRQGAAIRRR